MTSGYARLRRRPGAYVEIRPWLLPMTLSGPYVYHHFFLIFFFTFVRFFHHSCISHEIACITRFRWNPCFLEKNEKEREKNENKNIIRETRPLTFGLLSVSVADQGDFYKGSLYGYSGSRRVVEEKSSRRLVGVTWNLPNSAFLIPQFYHLNWLPLNLSSIYSYL